MGFSLKTMLVLSFPFVNRTHLLSFWYDKKVTKDYFQKSNASVEGVIVGKAIYSGALEIKKAIKALNKHAQS